MLEKHPVIAAMHTMLETGQMQLHYIICPICNRSMNKTKQGVLNHLNTHVKEGTVPKKQLVILHFTCVT